MEIGNLIARPFQLFFVAIVIGLSASLIKEQVQYSVPSVTNFAAACGAFGFLAFIVGIAAVFVQKLQGLVMLVLDGIATLFFLAGSIALAVKLGVHSCTGNEPRGWNDRAKSEHNILPPNPYCAYNPIIAGGATVIPSREDPEMYSFDYLRPNSWFVSRCRKAQALDAFMFFALVAFAASFALDLLSTRRKRVSAA